MSQRKLTLLAIVVLCLLGLSPATSNIVLALTPTVTKSHTPTPTITATHTRTHTPTPTITNTPTGTIASGCLVVSNLNDPGQCSLRDVIASVPDGGTVTFAQGLTGTIQLTQNLQQIIINKNVTITGPGAEVITVSGVSIMQGADTNRIFRIEPNRVVTISGLRIANGMTRSANGGNIRVAQNSQLTLRDVRVENGSVFFSGSGGGVYNEGTLFVYNSTFKGNNAGDVNLGAGGALYNVGTAVIANSTIANNVGVYASGVASTGSLTLHNVTIANNANRVQSSPAGLYSSGTLTISNTIIAENTKSNFGSDVTAANCDISGTVNGMNNLESSAGFFTFTCPTSAGFFYGEAKLSALGNFAPNNTYMLALQLGSDAINTGDPATCANPYVNSKDQRGVTRPFSTRCDIGAYEYDTPFATYTPSATVTPTDTFTPSPTPTITVIPPRDDTIGVYNSGMWYLRNSNTTGNADIVAAYGGDPSDLPVVGDWNGDTIDTLGVYRGITGQFILSNSNTAPIASIAFTFGNPGDRPLHGRWSNAFTSDGVGVYRNSNGILYQKNSLTTGFADNFAIFGDPGDQGVAGDWNNDGLDSIGVYRSSNNTWYLSNDSEPSGITLADISFAWTIGTNAPVTGDWDGAGGTTIGYYNQDTAVFRLQNANAPTGTASLFAYGAAGSIPVAGKWTASVQPPVAGMIIGSNQSGGAHVEPGGDAD
jgi:hypothetical protein